MKNILFIIVLLFPFCVIAQKNKNIRKKDLEKSVKHYEKIFAKHDKDFNIFEAPIAFKDAPLVVLCNKKHISFLRNMGSSASSKNQIRGAFRTRILINDQAMVKEFSEFYFQESELFSITLVKKDKSSKEIDLDNAITVKTEVPQYYENSYHSSSYSKIAIPNLEVGDILDYHKVFVEPHYNGTINLAISLATEYPVVMEEIIFDIDKFWAFYYNTLNGASSFKQDENGGIDANGRKRKIIKRFVLKSENTPATTFEPWSNSYASHPMFKIMALQRDHKLYDKKVTYKKGFDYLDFFKDFKFQDPYFMQLYKFISSDINRNETKNLALKEKADRIYRGVQTYFLTEQFDGIVKADNPKAKCLKVSRDYVALQDHYSAFLVASALKDYDIESDVVIAHKSQTNGLDNVLNREEIEFGVYIPSLDKFYWRVDNFAEPGEIPTNLQGVEGVSIPFKQINKSKQAIFDLLVPKTTYEDNVYHVKSIVNVKSNNSLEFNNTITLTGGYEQVYRPLLLYNTPYYWESLMLNLSTKRLNKINKKQKKGKDQVQYDAENVAYLEKKKVKVEKWLENEYSITEFIDYEILNYGYESDPLSVSFDFTSVEYLKKAGPNLIFDLGQLIAKQSKLDAENLTNRKADIFYDYSRTIENNITINLPAGKVAKGLDALSFDIDNEDASFKSIVTQSGDQLSVKTTKIYKNNRIPADRWSNIVEMINAANEFYEKKVILK